MTPRPDVDGVSVPANRGADGEALIAALLVVGEARVALPAELIDQAIALPAALGPSVPGETAMLGSFEHAGLSFPLVDLGPCLGLGSTPAEPDRTVVLVGAGGRRAGLLVDRVDSVRALPRDLIVRLSGRGDLPYAIAKLADHAHPVVVIEERDLLATPGMVFANAPAAAMARRQGREVPRAVESARALLSFSRDGAVYGIDIAQISEIVTDPEPVPMALPIPNFLGTIRTRQEEVVLLDHPAPGTGGRPSGVPPAQALVLQVETLRFALPVDAIHAISRPRPGEIVPLPEAAGENRSPAAGFAPAPVGDAPLIVLEGARVLAAPGVRALVEQQHRGRHAASEAASLGRTEALVELHAGERFFARLHDIRELATVPRASIVLAQARRGIDGYLQHRGKAIAVVDLMSRLDPDAVPGETAKIVIMSAGDVGFVIEDAAAIEHFHIAQSRGMAANAALRGGNREAAFHRHWRMVEGRCRQGSRLISILDLSGIAEELDPSRATPLLPAGDRNSGTQAA